MAGGTKPQIGNPVPKNAYAKRMGSPRARGKFRGLYCCVKGKRRRRRVVELGNDFPRHSTVMERLEVSEAGYAPGLPNPLTYADYSRLVRRLGSRLGGG